MCIRDRDKVLFELWATALIINRVFLIPAQLNFYYYDFFSHHPKVLWTDSSWLLLDKVIGYPYDLPIPNIIGYEYFNRPETSANTGWLGSGYAHAGALGVFLYAIILGLLFKFLDYKSKALNKNFITTSFAPFVVYLFSSDLKTMFLTHGLIIYILVLMLIKEQKKHG